MALTLQPIRGSPQHSGETGTRLTTAIHSRLFSRFFSDRGGTSVHRLRRKEVKSVELFWQFRSTAQKCSFNDGPFRFVIIGKNCVGI